MKTVPAKFITKHGDIFWGMVTMTDGAPPKTARLEQYAQPFTYDYTDDLPIYKEI